MIYYDVIIFTNKQGIGWCHFDVIECSIFYIDSIKIVVLFGNVYK